MGQLIIARNYFIHRDDTKVKDIESQRKMIFSDFMSYRDFNDSTLLFSDNVWASLYYAYPVAIFYRREKVNFWYSAILTSVGENYSPAVCLDEPDSLDWEIPDIGE